MKQYLMEFEVGPEALGLCQFMDRIPDQLEVLLHVADNLYRGYETTYHP